MEPTATIDPNDNAFQFALVDRTNQIWDFADKNCPINLSLVTCHLSLLIDHWVPNWAEGYNLPFYYSHVPQIIIVGSWRLLHSFIGLFTSYHWVIYLLLCFFPLSVFALRIIDLPWLGGRHRGLARDTPLDRRTLRIGSIIIFVARIRAFEPIICHDLAATGSCVYLEIVSNKHKIRSFGRRSSLCDCTVMGHLGIGIIALLSLIPSLWPTRPNKHW